MEILLEDRQGFAWTFSVPESDFRKELQDSQWHGVYVVQLLREDDERLYGFSSLLKRQLFLSLWELESIGPKLAATCVAELSTDVFWAMLSGQKLAPLKVTGLGPKSLEKLSHGLQQSRTTVEPLLKSLMSSASGSHSAPKSLHPSVFEALIHLGLRPTDVDRLVREISQEGSAWMDQAVPTQIRLLLQKWGQTRSLIPNISSGVLAQPLVETSKESKL